MESMLEPRKYPDLNNKNLDDFARMELEKRVKAEVARNMPTFEADASLARSKAGQLLLEGMEVAPGNSPRGVQAAKYEQQARARDQRHQQIRQSVREEWNELFPHQTAPKTADVLSNMFRDADLARQDVRRANVRARRLQAAIDPLANQLAQRVKELEVRRAQIRVGRGCCSLVSQLTTLRAVAGPARLVSQV